MVITGQMDIDEKSLTPPASHLPNGKFAPGNKISVGNAAGRGFAKVSSRIETIIDNKSVADINYQLSRGQFEGLLGRDAIAYRRAQAAIYGAADDVEFVTDRVDGPVVKKTEMTGKGGGPIAVATADVTALLLDMSQRAQEDKK